MPQTRVQKGDVPTGETTQHRPNVDNEIPCRRHVFRKEMFLQGRQLNTDPMWTTVSPSKIECVSLCEHDVMCGSVLYVDRSDQCQGYMVWEWDLPTQRSATVEGAVVFAKII
ncbi:hypothetical protein ScPMuIL_010216 [Solemya velum]